MPKSLGNAEPTVDTKVGDIIKFEKDSLTGWEGEVTKVNENSVVVAITKRPIGAEFGFDRTVVNHKRYKIICV